MTAGSRLLTLPPEILYNVLSNFEDPRSLCALAASCSELRDHAYNELIWKNLLLRSAPNLRLRDIKRSRPSQSFRELFMEHHPYWFLPKHKIWFGDNRDNGELLISEYNARSRTIDCTYLEAVPATEPIMASWSHDESVNMNLARPIVRLQTTGPKLILYPNTSNKWLEEEIDLGPESLRSLQQLFAARPMPPALQMPKMALWPPQTIPALERVRNDSQNAFTSKQHKPRKMSEASSATFRIRDTRLLQKNFAVSNVITYGTLLPETYTPTADKPWRGIWVGDYRDKGFEFILLLQSDSPKDCAQPNLDPESEDETEQGFTGRLEAVKLTGDRVVPRGMHTFLCDDLSQAAPLEVSYSDVFSGCPAVDTRDFKEDEHNKQVTREAKSKLIFVNKNRLALWMMEQSEIVFFERVSMTEYCLASEVRA